ncbi:ABC transporter substrate-binding protein [Microbacterium sp. 18062]|uniref:ABC transporter substrate-binding protein n=1 Tax=Microbacterium sp. 18062 TaxID=2681410 RepID=UPI001356AE99|nr:ABC transporter substrate-binding protein [Microbacterium sp. 18062]
MFSFMRSVGAASALVLTAALVAGCTGPAPSATNDLAHVTVATPSPSALAWMYYYIAEPLGFYEEEGLEVELVGSVPGNNPAQAIATGSVEYAGAQLSLALPVIESDDADLVYLGFSDRWPFRISVLDDSPITSYAGLSGKEIGIRDEGDVAPATAMLTDAGLEEDDYELVRLGQGATVAASLVSGDIDAMYASPLNENFVKTQTGTAVRRLPSAHFDEFVNSGFLADRAHIDVGTRIARAIAKAFVWSEENLDSAIDLLAEVQPEAVTDRDAAIETMSIGIVDSLEQLHTEWDIDPNVLDAQIQVFSPGSTLTAQDIVDDDARAAVWAFDLNALRAAARAGDVAAAKGLNH